MTTATLTGHKKGACQGKVLTDAINTATEGNHIRITFHLSSAVISDHGSPRLFAGIIRYGKLAMRSRIGVTLLIGVRFHVQLASLDGMRQSIAGAWT